MAQHWMTVTSPENFKVDRERGFLCTGFSHRFRNLVNQVRPGDKVAVYVIRSNRFGATLEVIREPYYDESTRIWVEEDEIWPCRFDTRPLLVLEEAQMLDVSKVLSGLTFVTDKQRAINWGLAFRYSLRRIPEEDYDLIESEMRKLATQPASLTAPEFSEVERAVDIRAAIMALPGLESKSLHDRLGEMLQAIGSQMGFNAFTRHKITPEHSEELDVAWLQGRNPALAVEIQISGDLHAALRKLEQARQFNYPKVILIIEEAQLPDLSRRIRFDNLRFWLDAWSIEAVYRLYKNGISFLDLYEKLRLSRYRERSDVDFVR